ncbi:16S rRNA (cytosine(1402)-N(4))-methyltransferase RsmH [Saccharicrinis sp. FJH54]|uniref:16S rRNA (cytosine(1402)-N(4))-methyltransferase RsmH n=1 Tax=Saccharicrinis sp. FJH54 TaxID=3344665 RepID=UPI0035D4EF9B
MPEYHLPVMLKESVAGLNIKPDGNYVDATFGGGGHSGEILRHIKSGRLFGFDQDKDTLNNIPENSQFTFINGNFRFLRQFMRYYKVENLDGVLADLGVSSHHFDSEDRGFSFRFNSKLDMRMNQSSDLTAYEVINKYDEATLADLFFYYGEIRNARLLASRIVTARSSSDIETTAQLRDIAVGCTSARHEMKYLSQAFQALRIEVNGEMTALKQMLEQAGDLLKPGGRLSVITYHSLEDRLVKNFFKSGNFSGVAEKDFYGNVLSPFTLVNRKVLIPDAEELDRNPRSRSAKLRVAEKN